MFGGEQVTNTWPLFETYHEPDNESVPVHEPPYNESKTNRESDNESVPDHAPDNEPDNEPLFQTDPGLETPGLDSVEEDDNSYKCNGDFRQIGWIDGVGYPKYYNEHGYDKNCLDIECRDKDGNRPYEYGENCLHETTGLSLDGYDPDGFDHVPESSSLGRYIYDMDYEVDEYGRYTGDDDDNDWKERKAFLRKVPEKCGKIWNKMFPDNQKKWYRGTGGVHGLCLLPESTGRETMKGLDKIQRERREGKLTLIDKLKEDNRLLDERVKAVNNLSLDNRIDEERLHGFIRDITKAIKEEDLEDLEIVLAEKEEYINEAIREAEAYEDEEARKKAAAEAEELRPPPTQEEIYRNWEIYEAYKAKISPKPAPDIRRDHSLPKQKSLRQIN